MASPKESGTGTPSISTGHFAQSLSNKMRTSFGTQALFTISMGDGYDYNILGEDLDPDDLYEEMLKYKLEVGESLQNSQVADDYLTDILSRMVFGSNFIERVGAGLDITRKLCQQVFKGGSPGPDISSEGEEPEYLALKEEMIRQGLPSDTLSILQRRREIIQHAKAARHILTEVYLHDKDLTEDIILNTHSILTYGMDTEEGYSWSQYSGLYRKESVGAGLHVFPPPNDVPLLMRKMITTQEKDLKNAVKKGEIDPILLAARYCHMFVNIHPFLDGNGRMCRLILNTLLLKYGGFLVCLGLDEVEREKYLIIAASASLREVSGGDDWDGDQDEDEGSRPKYYRELASFVLKYVRDELRGFVRVLEGEI